MKNGLPPGWVQVPLKILASYVNGRSFKATEWEKAGLPIIRIQNLNDPARPYNYSSKQHDESFRVRKGDLLVAWSASLGVFVWEGEDAWLNQHIFRVAPNLAICSKDFLFFALTVAIKDLYKKTHGTGMVHVTKSTFEAHEILLPPLNEQRRIVAKLEKLLDKVDSCQKRLGKIPILLKRFRQAVLAAACSGQLTVDWREQHPQRESVELLAIIRAERVNAWAADREKLALGRDRQNRARDSYPPPMCLDETTDTDQLPSLPEGWAWVALDDVAHSSTGLRPSRASLERCLSSAWATYKMARLIGLISHLRAILKKLRSIKLDGKAFSEAEIQQRLKEASRITWKRIPDHEPGELNWTGEQNGKVIFDANEANNGRGTYLLTITTR